MRQIVLRADSHGRGLAWRLIQRGYLVDCFFKPSARHSEVINIGSNNPEDILIVLGETNNTWSLSRQKYSLHQIKVIFQHIDVRELKTTLSKVIYFAIPKKRGARSGDFINAQICKLNGKVYNL